MDVLKTFVDFYCEMLRAVNLHLYRSLELEYPINEVQEQNLDFIIAKAKLVRQAAKKMNMRDSALQQQLFRGQTYKISREVPRDPLELVVLSGGGDVVSA